MTLFAVQFYDSDGFTYSCQTVLGIFDAQAKTDDLILRLVEKHADDAGDHGQGNIANYQVYEFNINEPWPAAEAS